MVGDSECVIISSNADIMNQAVIDDKNSDQNKRKRQNLTTSTIYEKTIITHADFIKCAGTFIKF